MTIREINTALCETCITRIKSGCPVIDSCPVDVLRIGKEGKPDIAYPGDCDSCFLCQDDCPNGAIEVTPEIDIPVFPY